MASLAEVVVRQAHMTFTKSIADEAFSEGLSKLVRTISQLKAKDVSLSRDVLSESIYRSSRAPVTYIGVYENQKFSMGIFVLKNGSRIPLHDHPGMHGILKVIKGTVKITSYSGVTRLTNNLTVPKDITQTLNEKEVSKLLPVEKHISLNVNEDDEPCVLTPSTGNFHEIRALSGSAAFVDVLAPPYDMKERDCHYYSCFETSCRESDVKTWLLKTPPPPDFWCDTAPYDGPVVDL